MSAYVKGNSKPRIPSVTPYWVNVPEDKISLLHGMKKRIGIIRLWPKQAAAEHESVERYRLAATLLGVEIVEIDRLGFIINGPRRKITKDDVDFVISLHFETPKSFDCFSWGALWNPIDFYVDWDVETFVDHQFSHDGYFTCNSPAIDRLARIELGDKYAETPMVQVNHSLSGPVYPAESRTDRRLVYCGINWERLATKSGRFDNLLHPIDQAGVLDVFGPETVQNVKVWEGFNGYRYQVPFDGQTLLKELSASGAVLALSSNAHLRSGVMTSRLFEGAAAGALVFADENPFVERYFADEVVPIQITGDSQNDAREIINKLEYYNNNPEEALRIANALQKKYIDNYMLHTQLCNVYDAYQKYKSDQSKKVSLTTGKIAYIIFWLDTDIPLPSTIIEDIKSQTHNNSHIVLVTPRSKTGNQPITGLPEDVKVHIEYVDNAYGAGYNSAGMFLCNVLDGLPEDIDYVSFSFGTDNLFSDYAYKMIEGSADNEYGSVCAVLTRHYDPATRHFKTEEFVHYWTPKNGTSRIASTLTNVLFRKTFLISQAGALQFLNFSGIQQVLRPYIEKMGVVSSPLVTFDLKLFEIHTRPSEQPYKAEKFTSIVRRYTQNKGNISTDSSTPLVMYSNNQFSAKMIMDLPENDKATILSDMLKSMPWPKPIMKLGGKILRFAFGIRKPKSRP